VFAERLNELNARPKILTIDIETSPNVVYSWGLYNQNISTNQIIEASRVLCFAAKWLDGRNVQFHSEFHDGRAEMVRAAWALLDEADVVVGYNHVKFDLPHLHREFFLAGLGPPSPSIDVDLLKVNRQRFKFVSNKLGYVTDVLGMDTKLETGGMGLWRAVLAGDESAWRKFRAYNRQDVLITEQLYRLLGPWLKGPHVGLWSGSMSSCHACGSSDLTPVGFSYTRTAAFPKVLCSCGAWGKVLRSGETRPVS